MHPLHQGIHRDTQKRRDNRKSGEREEGAARGEEES